MLYTDNAKGFHDIYVALKTTRHTIYNIYFIYIYIKDGWLDSSVSPESRAKPVSESGCLVFRG